MIALSKKESFLGVVREIILEKNLRAFSRCYRKLNFDLFLT